MTVRGTLCPTGLFFSVRAARRPRLGKRNRKKAPAIRFQLRNFFTGAFLIPFQLYQVFAGLLLTFSSNLRNDYMPIRCRVFMQQYSRYGRIFDCLVALLYTILQISFPIICFDAFLVLFFANDIRASFVRINPISDER